MMPSHGSSLEPRQLFDVAGLAKVFHATSSSPRRSLFKVPIFGRAMRVAGMVEISRENRKPRSERMNSS